MQTQNLGIIIFNENINYHVGQKITLVKYHYTSVIFLYTRIWEKCLKNIRYGLYLNLYAYRQLESEILRLICYLKNESKHGHDT